MSWFRRLGIAALGVLFVFSGFPVMERTVTAAEAKSVVSDSHGCCGAGMKGCCCSSGGNCGYCSGHSEKACNSVATVPAETSGLRWSSCPGPSSKKLALITSLREIVPPAAVSSNDFPCQHAPNKSKRSSPDSPSFSPDTPPPRKISA